MAEANRQALRGIRRALVVGLGTSGRAAATALARAKVRVTAADRSPDAPDATDATDVDGLDGVEVRAGVDDDELTGLVDAADLVVPSPGVPAGAPALRAALDAGTPVWSEPELGWRLFCEPADGPARTVVGVTGTNGKTSVTELTTAMLASSGLDATACGNIGHAFTSAAAATPSETILVAELSSFQLHFVASLRPKVGVLLNVSPDHLDWHGDLAAYERAKTRIWEAQTRDDWAVCSHDDEPAARLARRHAGAQLAWASAVDVVAPGVGPSDGDLVASLPRCGARLLPIEDLPERAPHHVANVAAAACAALLAGATPGGVADAARDFRPGPHRMQVVASRDGVEWIDDSKATNPHAARAAIRAVRARGRTVVLVAGGLAKGVDLGPLGEELEDVRHVIALGQAAADIARLAEERDLETVQVDTIEDAVKVARRVAVPGDTVLLSPACASFDQFADYKERGERFAAAARAAVQGEPVTRSPGEG